MEESITLDELYELYEEVLNREMRMYNAMARAQGADVKVDFGTPTHQIKQSERGREALDRVRQSIAEKKGGSVAESDFSKLPLAYKG